MRNFIEYLIRNNKNIAFAIFYNITFCNFIFRITLAGKKINPDVAVNKNLIGHSNLSG
jgi:hypothetical protein